MFDLDATGLEKLHSIAFMKSASERENHNIKEVQVFLPLALLQVSLKNFIPDYQKESLKTMTALPF